MQVTDGTDGLKSGKPKGTLIGVILIVQPQTKLGSQQRGLKALPAVIILNSHP